MTESTQEKIADLLNDASLGTKDIARILNLKQVQELILEKDPDLLDNFLEEILQFQLDKSSEIRKFIVSFIEESCKRDPGVIVKVIDNLRFLLYDENVNVQKRAYLAMITVLKNTIKWLAKIRSIDENIVHTWEILIGMKNHIIRQLDSENDGVRTASIKFIETFVILSSKDNDLVSIDDGSLINLVPEDHQIIKKKELAEESEYLMDRLLDYTLTSHISSVNLISSIACLCNIARRRPQYLSSVVKVFEKLKTNLPPTLSKSQLDSVKKQMKLHLTSLLKPPNFNQYQMLPKITDILLELGVSQNEINKLVPKSSFMESRKRNATHASNETDSVAKRLKTPNEFVNEPFNSGKNFSEKIIDELDNMLNIQENVVDLVLLTMVRLPENMPSSFLNNYKPIDSAGTAAQKKHLAKLLANQLMDTMDGLDLASQKNIKMEHEHAYSSQTKNNFENVDRTEEEKRKRFSHKL